MKKVFILLFLSVFALATSTVALAAQKTDSSRSPKQVAGKNTAKRGAKTRSVRSSATNKTRQKAAAEAERTKLRHRLTHLKKEIGQTEVARAKANEELARSEKAIRTTERSLSDLEKRKILTENRLVKLTEEQKQLAATVSRQQNQLASLLRQHYVSGNENRMKLLFSGDNPNRINRELQYMSYVFAAYAELIESLRENINTVTAKRAQTNEVRQELEKIVAETSEQKNALEKEKAQHAVLVARLADKLNVQKKQAEQLEKDEKRLSGLVDRLSKAIEAQRKAAEKRAAQRLAEQKTRKQAGQIKQGKKPAVVRRETEADRVKEAPYEPVDTASAFGRMRGRLKMPVSGTLTARYGMKRADGPSWKGIFIRTSPGAPVHAVAGGRVVFADFLRGFGNLMIVDHGNQYMTIYGNAQSLLKRVGDNVASGDVLAGAGNTGENAETGLYFEIRHNGRALNPLDWIR